MSTETIGFEIASAGVRCEIEPLHGGEKLQEFAREWNCACNASDHEWRLIHRNDRFAARMAGSGVIGLMALTLALATFFLRSADHRLAEFLFVGGWFISSIACAIVFLVSRRGWKRVRDERSRGLIRTDEEQAFLDDPVNRYALRVNQAAARCDTLLVAWNEYLKRNRLGLTPSLPDERETELTLQRTREYLVLHLGSVEYLLTHREEKTADPTPIALAASLDDVRAAEAALRPTRIAETYRIAEVVKKADAELEEHAALLEATELEHLTRHHS